jgi:hypothetical protein
MGYCIFTVLFSNGQTQAYLTGDAVDFITYPEGLGKTDAIDVMPHVGRDRPYLEGPDYFWCLFSG